MTEEIIETADVSETSISPMSNTDYSVATEMGMDEVFARQLSENDPDFAQHIARQATDEKTDADDDDDGELDTGDAQHDADDDSELDTDTNADDEDSGEDSETEPASYADDVIPNFKGEDFAKLPDAAKDALSSYYTKMQAKAVQADEYKAKYDALVNDPVVGNRKTMLDAGRGDIAVRGMTNDEKQTLIDSIGRIVGLEFTDDNITQEETKSILSAIDAGLDAIAKTMAQDYADRAMAATESARKQADTIKRGTETLLGLSQFNKALEVKEKDLSKFYTFKNGVQHYNEEHPEIETFKNGIGKISEWAARKNYDFAAMLNLGAQSFYAAAAVDLGLPVAFNTKERDTKIAVEARKKALSPFLKQTGGTLNIGGNTNLVREKADGVVVNGMDVERLVNDSAYYDKMVLKNPLDEAWLAKIEAAAARGRTLIEQRKK